MRRAESFWRFPWQPILPQAVADMQHKMREIVKFCRFIGVPAGILADSEPQMRKSIDMAGDFVDAGAETSLLQRLSRTTAQSLTTA